MNGILISAEQIAERDAWELRLKLGKCTLEEALFGMLSTGAPATEFLLESLHRAFDAYRSGQLLMSGERRPKDLAEAFGAIREDTQKIESELHASNVYALVEELHLKHPKGHPDHLSLSRSDSRLRTSETAYAVAARSLNMSESAVVKKYYQGGALHVTRRGPE